MCAHFGSCEYFTIIDVSNGKPKEVSALSNASPDGVHNCAAPAELLKNNKVDAVIVSGIGGRPLVSLTTKGIRVFGGAFGLVSDASMIMHPAPLKSFRKKAHAIAHIIKEVLKR